MAPNQLGAKEVEEQMCLLHKPQELLLLCVAGKYEAQKHPRPRTNAGIQAYLNVV